MADARPNHTLSQSATTTTRYTLTFFVPETRLDACQTAVFSAGAGRIGNYSNVSFSLTGTSQFMPTAGAKPATGEIGKLEVGPEVRVEVFCGSEEIARQAVKALKEAHPYEEVVYWVRKVEDF